MVRDRKRAVRILVAIFLVASLIVGGLALFSSSAKAQTANQTDTDQMRSGSGDANDMRSGNQTANGTQPASSNVTYNTNLSTIGSSNSSTPTPTPTVTGPGSATRADVDIWVEHWFNRMIDIHKVMPDGERDSPAKVVRMFYNLSVEIYAKDNSQPFHYVIYVAGAKVNEGDATYHLHWVTSVPLDQFNMSVDVTQGGRTRHAEWAYVVGIPGEDTGPGSQAPGQQGGPSFEQIPVGFIDKLTWKLLASYLTLMVAAFTVVGGYWLERIERMGWSRQW